MQFSIIDVSPSHILEAGIDVFNVYDDVNTSTTFLETSEISLSPNPASTFTKIIDGPDHIVHAELVNSSGVMRKLSVSDSNLTWGSLPTGQYYIRLIDNDNRIYISPIQIIR